MALRPGFLSDWPWKSLGNFKYVILAPWVAHSIYPFLVAKGERERSILYVSILPLILSRMIHNQIWISLSRHRTAKGTNRIVDKSIEFDQVDRERNWDDQIVFMAICIYIAVITLPGFSNTPVWRADGVILIALLHTGPVEFLYYWLHRALHHHFLYSRYHSHHHSSIVTEPITSVTHPFAEHVAYFLLFSIPMFAAHFTGIGSIAAFGGYITYIDFMNNLGHCNFEVVPKWLFAIFPLLKYFMYTPSFHSLHHTQFRTNYSLFMPMYDYIYNTMDKTTEQLYETSLKKKEDMADVVYLTHLTTPESIYHIRLGFASLASKPQSSKWYMWAIWPFITCWSMALTWIWGRTVIIERNQFKDLKVQTWAIPKYNIQYFLGWQRESINRLIKESILEANNKRVRVLSLGLLNQGEELNRYGELYIQRYPHLKLRVVDGTSLAVAVVLHNIPKETTQVLLRGNLSKVASFIAFALVHKEIKVTVLHEEEQLKLQNNVSKLKTNLSVSGCYAHNKIWLVGDRFSDEEQLRAPIGTQFFPFSQFPPKRLRKDCFYHTTPAMLAPSSLENLDSCENWLPRRAMSAWRVAGIVHALEEWNVNECGHALFDVEKIWQASLGHGFQPLTTIPPTSAFKHH